MKNSVNWLLSIFVAFIFAQSLFFKFSGAAETVIIFNTIAAWMAGIGFGSSVSSLFADYGAYAVGSVELVSVILILMPKMRMIGAVIGSAVISGAIFFHLFTPLGIDRVIDAAGNTDGGGLFYTALALLVANVSLIALNRPNQAAKEHASIEPQLV